MVQGIVVTFFVMAWTWVSIVYIKPLPFKILVNVAGIFCFVSFLNLFFTDSIEELSFLASLATVLTMSSIVNIGAAIFISVAENRKGEQIEETSN